MIVSELKLEGLDLPPGTNYTDLYSLTPNLVASACSGRWASGEEFVADAQNLTSADISQIRISLVSSATLFLADLRGGTGTPYLGLAASAGATVVGITDSGVGSDSMALCNLVVKPCDLADLLKIAIYAGTSNVQNTEPPAP